MIFSLNKDSNLSIKKLCSIAKVSTSGYYSWLNKEYSEKDLEIIDLIKQIFWANNRKFGYRRITMELRRKFNIVVNHKKVLRIMNEFGLKTKIRITKKHAVAQRKNEHWTVADNLLKCNFKTNKPNSIYSTDITYLILKNQQRFYLSAVKDLASGEIVAYSVSNKQNIDLVLNTINQLEKIKSSNCILHSDQGCLYSSFLYIQRLKQLNIQRSMSAAGKPTHNAPIESFFGHFKDEVDYKHCNNFAELKDKIDKYVYYYNTSRYQWNKNMLAPIEIREQLKSYNTYPF